MYLFESVRHMTSKLVNLAISVLYMLIDDISTQRHRSSSRRKIS